MKPSLGPCSSCSQHCPRLEVSLSRLRICHTRLAHSHLVTCEAPPICGRCQVRLTVFHVSVECPAYSVPHNWFFPFLTLVAPRELLSLLSESPTFGSDTFCIFKSVRPRVRSLMWFCVPQLYNTWSAACC